MENKKKDKRIQFLELPTVRWLIVLMAVMSIWSVTKAERFGSIQDASALPQSVKGSHTKSSCSRQAYFFEKDDQVCKVGSNFDGNEDESNEENKKEDQISIPPFDWDQISSLFIELSNPKEYAFTQVLDHFDTNSDSTWLQRYWVNSWYFNGSGPVFLYIGGESKESGSYIFYDTLVTQLARETGALMVALEHRYYGYSRPTPDASEKNLRFLSMDQAVADLATFRDFIHASHNLSSENKWVSMGCSYPGELSALLRLRHPDKIHAALSSSAPIKYELQYPGYYKIVNSVINASYPECALALGQAMTTVNSLLESEKGRAKLITIFKYRFANFNKTEFLLTKFVLNWWRNAIRLDSSVNSYKSQFFCNTMLDNSLGEPIQRLANIFQKTGSNLQESDWSNFNESDWSKVACLEYERNWIYHSCFDLATFTTSRSTDLPLSADLPLDYFFDGCRELFNETFSVEKLKSVIERRIQELGGDQYKGTRVVFVNGDRDPWSGAGLMDNSSVNPYSKVIVIEGGSHCVDFRGHQEKNPPKINHAIAQIKQQIKDYLEE